MNRSLFLAAATASSIAFGQFAAAQTTVATDPVGFSTVQCLANSDTFVSLPMTRPPAFTGSIQSASGSTITVSGSPWTDGQFVYAAPAQRNRYYALIGPAGTTNPKEGRMFQITSNSTNTLTVDTSADNLTDVPANAQLVVIPHWTLATVFPPSDSTVSFTPTTSTRTFKTQLLIPNYDGVGTNLSASAIYFFSNNVNNSTNNVGWRVVGDNATDKGDDVLIPDGYFIVRNLNNAPTLPLAVAGAVLMKKLSVAQATAANQAQDNALGMQRPVDLRLDQTGLNPADGSFVATTSTRSFGDQLLVFNNAVAALNKSPSAIYFYSNNVNNSTNNVGWRLVGDNTTDRSATVIPAGSGFIVRKAASGTGNPVFWTNSPTY